MANHGSGCVGQAYLSFLKQNISIFCLITLYHCHVTHFTMVFIIRNVEMERWWPSSEGETLTLEKCVLYNVEMASGLRQDEAEWARPSHSTEITQWDAGPVWSGSAFTGWSESCGIPASSPTLRKQPPHGCSPAPSFYGSSVFWDFFPGSASTLKFSTLQLNNKRCLFIKWLNHRPISPCPKRGPF